MQAQNYGYKLYVGSATADPLTICIVVKLHIQCFSAASKLQWYQLFLQWQNNNMIRCTATIRIGIHLHRQPCAEAAAVSSYVVFEQLRQGKQTNRLAVAQNSSQCNRES